MSTVMICVLIGGPTARKAYCTHQCCGMSSHPAEQNRPSNVCVTMSCRSISKCEPVLPHPSRYWRYPSPSMSEVAFMQRTQHRCEGALLIGEQQLSRVRLVSLHAYSVNDPSGDHTFRKVLAVVSVSRAVARLGSCCYVEAEKAAATSLLLLELEFPH